MYEEALAVLVEEHTFVLVQTKGSAYLTKSLIPTSARTGAFVNNFKHFNMLVKVNDPTDWRYAASTSTILIGKPSFKTFCMSMMLDESEWGDYHLPSYRTMNWEITFLSTGQQRLETFLLREMQEKLWDYQNFEIWEASDTALAVTVRESIKMKKWKSTRHFSETLGPIISQGQRALRERREEDALDAHMTARNLLSSTARSPQGRASGVTFKRALYKFFYFSSSGVATVFTARAERSEILRQEHAEMAAKYANHAILAIEDHLGCLPLETRPSAERMAHTYYCLALASRWLGKSDVAIHAIETSLKLVPESATYRAALQKIRHLNNRR